MQKAAVSIVLSDHKVGRSCYTYDVAFAILDIKLIGVRRFKLYQKFAKKTLKSRQHANLFRINHNLFNTRHRSESFTNRCNIWRYIKSAVNYLTRILNNEEESWNISDCVL